MLTRIVVVGGPGQDTTYSNTSADLGYKIHPDDTVGQAKLKLVELLNCSPSEMVFFGERTAPFSVDALYQDLSQSGTLPITRPRLMAALGNIHPVDVSGIPNKDEYSYQDLLAVGAASVAKFTFPIGVKYTVDTKYPVCANPFDVVEPDMTLVRDIRRIASTQDAQVLMHYTTDVLYVATAEAVAKFETDAAFDPGSLLSTYFPTLLAEGPIDPAVLVVRHTTLLEKALLEVSALKPSWNVVNMVYELGSEEPAITRTEAGITDVSFVHYPAASTTIPVDVLFKVIMTSEERPLTKYNAGARMEKLFRLYAPDVAQNGRRIPKVRKSHAAKLARALAREKGVGVYLQWPEGEMTMQFSSDASVRVTAMYTKPIALNKIAGDIALRMNDVYSDINSFTRQSGYVYSQFTGFTADVEIVDIKYVERLAIPGKCSFTKNKACLRHVFAVEDSSTSGTTLMTAVRVGYYNKMSAVDAFITRAVKRGVLPETVVHEIESGFGLSNGDASDRVSEWLRNVEVEQNAFRGRRAMVQSSAGISIVVTEDRFSDSIVMTASDITELGALPVLSQQFQGFVRISCKGIKHGMSSKQVKTICDAAKGGVIETRVFGEPQQQPFLEGDMRGLASEANELVFAADVGAEEDFLDELFGDMDPDDSDAAPDADNDDFLSSIIGEDDADLGPSVDVSPATGDQTPADVMPQLDEEPARENIVGMSLTNPNYFFDRMFRRDSSLFLKKGDGRFNAYSRLCPHNLRRQPVVLSDGEKERIQRENPGAIDFTKAVRYGSTEEKANWYVCPRYWCLLNNTPLTQAQVDAGECGGEIIPFNAKTVPEGKYIFEFNAGTRNNEHIDQQGNYIEHYPGFLDSDRHPDGKCIPCCFKGPWEKAALAKRRKQCLADDGAEATPQYKRTAAKEPAKFPLREGERGFLASSVEAVLATRNVACQVSSKNRTLRSDHPCFLRAGVSQEKGVSFVAAIGAAHEPPLSVEQTRDRLVEVCTVEVFSTLQNGSLVAAFANPASAVLGTTAEEISQRTTVSHGRFIEFLQSPGSILDYTYLWDLVCLHFYDEPRNIVMLSMVDDDGTDNVNLICPTNHYRSSYYNNEWPTVIIVEKDRYFEPIFVFIDTSRGKVADRKKVIRTISAGDARIPLPERKAVQKLGELLSGCGAESMYSRAYIFESGDNAETTYRKLDEAGVRVRAQVLNYDGKIVGLSAEVNGKTTYVPTAPSGSLLGLSTTTIDDDSLWSGYLQTTTRLASLAKKAKIPIAPKVKIVQGGLVVGILTVSDQFVQLSVPAEDVVKDGLIVRQADNDNDVDAVVFSTDDVDKERGAIMQRLRLEKDYFGAFRNTMKHLLTQPVNLAYNLQLSKLAVSNATYLSRLRAVREVLEGIGAPVVRFAEVSPELIENMATVATCIDSTDCESSTTCLSTDGVCVLIVPDKHLITGNNNKEVYYTRVADEILRYPRVREYLLGQDTYLQLGKDDYDLGDNEIIVLSSLLFGEYYASLVPRVSSALVGAPTYDDVMSSRTVDVAEVVDLREGAPSVSCASIKKPVGSKEVWFNLLPDSSYVQRYAPIAPCGFDMLAVVASTISSSIVTREDIRQVLAKEYQKLLPAKAAEVIATLRAQGKRELMSKYSTGQVSFPDVVFSEDYWITNLDLRLVAQALRIPLVLISGSKVMDNKKRALLTDPAIETPAMVLIKQHGIKSDTPQAYSLLYHGSDIMFAKESFAPATLKLLADGANAPLFVKASGARRLLVVE